jgi:hypothetical protein
MRAPARLEAPDWILDYCCYRWHLDGYKIWRLGLQRRHAGNMQYEGHEGWLGVNGWLAKWYTGTLPCIDRGAQESYGSTTRRLWPGHQSTGSGKASKSSSSRYNALRFTATAQSFHLHSKSRLLCISSRLATLCRITGSGAQDSNATS